MMAACLKAVRVAPELVSTLGLDIIVLYRLNAAKAGPSLNHSSLQPTWVPGSTTGEKEGRYRVTNEKDLRCRQEEIRPGGNS
jgi:hypothetical protein